VRRIAANTAEAYGVPGATANRVESKMSEADSITPVGVNHVVLNVRDIEESHRFWTDIVGLKQVSELRKRPEMPNMPTMRFYSGDHGGKFTHHDVALVENPNLPPAKDWALFGTPLAINHIAIAMPDRDSFVKKLAELQAKGVKFNMRVNHGVTHSVYINDPNGYGVELLYELPREMWEGDIDAGINYFQPLPTEGEEALKDDLENAPSFGRAAAE
jgi:catechol 2,3-dioxygenase